MKLAPWVGSTAHAASRPNPPFRSSIMRRTVVAPRALDKSSMGSDLSVGGCNRGEEAHAQCCDEGQMPLHGWRLISVSARNPIGRAAGRDGRDRHGPRSAISSTTSLQLENRDEVQFFLDQGDVVSLVTGQFPRAAASPRHAPPPAFLHKRRQSAHCRHRA